MIEAILPEEQKIFRDNLRKFLRKEVIPFQDKNPLRSGEFPWEQIRLYQKLGLMGLLVPEEYGGLSGATFDLTILMEECARSGVFVPPLTHFGATRCIHHFGSEEQKRRYLPPIAVGETIAAYAQTEAGAGLDATAMKTAAIPDGDGYVLNGRKCFITGAPVASIFVVVAKTDTKIAKKAHGISAFIAERNMPGLSIGTIEKKMGSHSLPTSEVLFEDCRIPRENLLVSQGDGFKKLMASFNIERIGNTAICVGRAEFAYERALAYSQQRETFGKPLCHNQGIQWMIAEMATKIKKARLLLYDAAYKETRGMNVTIDAAMAKMNANEEMVQLISDAMQILGGYGYMEEYKLETAYRDTRGLAFGGGTPQILRNRIAYELLKGHLPF